MRRFDFWFDYSCPYAYLASTQVEALASRTGATLTWCPMLLGGVFRAVGTPQNLSEVLSKAKAAHNVRDMQRWADEFGVKLTMPKGHPFRTVEALRATLLSGISPKVVHGFFDAYWIRGEVPSERGVIERVLSDAGLDERFVEDVFRDLEKQDVKDDLRRRTDAAIAAGVFGAPAFVVGSDLFWGQDRMHFVERALAALPSLPPAR